MDRYIRIDGDHVRVRKYSASATGPKAVVKIEFEIDDPATLGYVLQDIAEAQKESQRQRAASVEKKKAKGPQAIEQQKMLGLPYYGGRS